MNFPVYFGISLKRLCDEVSERYNSAQLGLIIFKEGGELNSKIRWLS